jgi:hypothetical protein
MGESWSQVGELISSMVVLEGFDVVEVADFAVTHQRDGCVLASHVTCSVYSVEVHLRLRRHITIDGVCEFLS